MKREWSCKPLKQQSHLLESTMGNEKACQSPFALHLLLCSKQELTVSIQQTDLPANSFPSYCPGPAESLHKNGLVDKHKYKMRNTCTMHCQYKGLHPYCPGPAESLHKNVVVNKHKYKMRNTCTMHCQYKGLHLGLR